MRPSSRWSCWLWVAGDAVAGDAPGGVVAEIQDQVFRDAGRYGEVSRSGS